MEKGLRIARLPSGRMSDMEGVVVINAGLNATFALRRDLIDVVL